VAMQATFAKGDVADPAPAEVSGKKGSSPDH
jgi:hypothetical protein